MNGELITELDELEGIEDEWRRLAVSCGNAFVTPEWLRAWLQAYGDERTAVAIAVAREPDGSLSGVLPLVRQGRRGRTVRFAGANLGDLFQPACEPGNERRVCLAAAGALAGGIAPDAVLVDYAPAAAEWPAALAAAVGGRAASIPQRSAELPFVAIEGLSWEDYLASRSKGFRKRLRYLERATARGHEVRVEELADASGFDRAFDSFFALHDLRWSERGGSSLASPRARELHRRFARAALERGWLRLRHLRIDGEPVAAFYGWRVGSRYAFYQGGFDPAWGKLSVGLQLVASSLRGAIEEGASEFDMLLGSEGYKARFTSQARPVTSLAFARRGRPAGVALRAEARLRRVGSGLAQGRGPIGHLARGVAGRLPGGRRS